MIHIHLSTNIYRPLKQVFSFVSNPENDFQWQYGTLATGAVSAGAVALGSTFRSVAHFMGQRIESLCEVTEYDLNHRYGFRSLAGPVEGHTVYTFEMAGGSTQVRISSELNQRELFKISDSIVEKKFKRQYKENFAMLKDLLESHIMMRTTQS
jgi:hypothetical protein